MNSKDTTKVEGICRDCKKEFSVEVQFFYDSVPNDKIFSAVTCPFCGAKDSLSFPFLFFDKNEHILYTVFASANFNGFERIRACLKNKYCTNRW